MSIDPYSSPLAYFGAELKRLRERAGLTQADVADATHYTVATVSAYETGRRIPSQDFAKDADKLFGTEDGTEDDDGDLARLQKLVERVSVRPWFRNRVEVERKATEIREYESYQIPGLLQTEDYANAVISSGRPMMSGEEIERAVAVRMTRQQILEPNSDLPADQQYQNRRAWFIMDESALQRIVGDAEIMKKQYEHLVEVAQQPNVTIQIIPNSEGSTCAYGRAFTVLMPANGASMIYLEDLIDAHYVRDRDQVAQFTLKFDHLRTNALTDQKSLQLIKGFIK